MENWKREMNGSLCAKRIQRETTASLGRKRERRTCRGYGQSAFFAGPSCAARAEMVPLRWWRQPDSNRRHPACKADALPAELCPLRGLVGLTGIEPVTSSLSGTRSNQLSYKPMAGFRKGHGTRRRLRHVSTSPPKGLLLRKEVIQPLVPQRLPCYDFIPITTHTLGRQTPDFGCRRLS